MPADAGSSAPERRTLGPVLLLGLSGSALATIGSARVWFAPDGLRDAPLLALTGGGGQAPLAVSLGLVCLAAWGALLVTRGRARRVLAWLGAAAAAGMLAAWVWAWRSVPDSLREQAADLVGTAPAVSTQPWYWLSGAGALVALLAALAGVRLAPGWPEMGRRYDAPPGRRPPGSPPDEEESGGLALWRALDQGRDPTNGPE